MNAEFKSGGWLDDLEKAKKQAADSGKPILALFSGSDWCPHCKAITKEVFDRPEFLAFAHEKLILLDVDMPQNGISDEQREVNKKLMRRYGVEYFPTVLLLSAEGEVTAELDARELDGMLNALKEQLA